MNFGDGDGWLATGEAVVVGNSGKNDDGGVVVQDSPGSRALMYRSGMIRTRAMLSGKAVRLVTTMDAMAAGEGDETLGVCANKYLVPVRDAAKLCLWEGVVSYGKRTREHLRGRDRDLRSDSWRNLEPRTDSRESEGRWGIAIICQ
jgi:hypothetical protein